MRNLEDEFRNLVNGMRAKIEEKKLAGELADDEASLLNDMVTDRVFLRGWNDSGCSIGMDSGYGWDYNDDGWSASSVC